MKFKIDTSLYCGAVAEVDLPIGDWDELKEWYIKWDILHYTLDGENWEEIELDSNQEDIIDWKRPSSIEVYECIKPKGE